jgi:hypothetical protein
VEISRVRAPKFSKNLWQKHSNYRTVSWVTFLTSPLKVRGVKQRLPHHPQSYRSFLISSSFKHGASKIFPWGTDAIVRQTNRAHNKMVNPEYIAPQTRKNPTSRTWYRAMVLIAYTPCKELQSRGTVDRRSATTHIRENHAPESEFE